MGTVYAMALALAPTPGAAAPTQTSAEALTQADSLETTSLKCPYTQHAKQTMDGVIEAHRTSLERRAKGSSLPAWGTDRLTIF